MEELKSIEELREIAKNPNNAKDYRNAAMDFVKAGATAQAAEKYGDVYTAIKNKQISSEMNSEANAAKNKNNEEFYLGIRPILEFDFSNITGNTKPEKEFKENRSYSKPLMIIALIFLTIPWLFVALCCCTLKGLDSIISLIASFTETAKRIIKVAFWIIIVYIIFRVVAYFIEFYVGVNIIPPIFE